LVSSGRSFRPGEDRDAYDANDCGHRDQDHERYFHCSLLCSLVLAEKEPAAAMHSGCIVPVFLPRPAHGLERRKRAECEARKRSLVETEVTITRRAGSLSNPSSSSPPMMHIEENDAAMIARMHR